MCQAEYGTAVVDTAAFWPLAVARREIAEASLARNNISRLGSRVAGSGLGDVQRNVEVSFLNRAATDDFAAKALTVNFADSGGADTFTSTSSAYEASLRIFIDEFADLGFVLYAQALSSRLGTPAVLEFKIGAAESTASQTILLMLFHSIFNIHYKRGYPFQLSLN